MTPTGVMRRIAREEAQKVVEKALAKAFPGTGAKPTTRKKNGRKAKPQQKAA